MTLGYRLGEIMIPLVIAAVLGAVFTGLELPMLRRLKAGQSIRQEGPEAHQAKSGTPTMGGIAIILALCITSVVLFPGTQTLVCCGVTLAYGLIGFTDDYIKVVKKRNLGLTAVQKLGLQILVAVLVAIYRRSFGTEIFIPFFKLYFDLGWLFIPFVAFVMVAMTNAVNLTDGLDGLASSVTAVVAFLFAMITIRGDMVFSAALCGACLGFLVFNHHPAKLFMGDTGSLALGGALSAVAIVSEFEFVLPVAGFIYVLEALSVIIQVLVFKTQNGRRFFRMAPIHHHFELGGWKETKVVAVFTAVTALLCVIAYFAVI